MTDPRLLNKSWRIRHLYKIRDKKKRLLIFQPNKAQLHFEEHRHTRNIILKSRQLGFTTLEAIDMMDDALWVRNYEGLFIAHELEPAKDIFDNKIKLAWTNFNLAGLYQADLNSARKLKLGFGDGSFSSITVDTSGRSGTYNRLHISEFAALCKKFPDRAREVIDGSIPAVPTEGRVDIESTAVESQGLFYDMFWEAWDRGEPTLPTQFKAHFYNWQWDEESQTTTPVDVPPEFRAYQALHKLSDSEISYYYMKYVSLGEGERSWDTMRREFPTTPEEAFAGSGHKLFDLEKLGRQETRRPIREYNGFKIYEDYKLGHRYGMGVDVSEGIGRDWATMVLWDFTPAKPKVVAEYANANIAPDMLAFEAKNLAEKYEFPLVAVERNNVGHATLSKLREIYPERHIWKDEHERFGWVTNLVSKPKMLYDLSTAVNEELVELSSPRLVSEARRYDKEELRVHNPRSEETSHFDLLMAGSIGFQMKDFVSAVRSKAVKTNAPRPQRGHGLRGV